MDLRLQLLETFATRGSDGNSYKVCAYDRLLLVPGTTDRWEPTGVVEYRLSDGRLLDVGADETMRILGSDVTLKAERV